MKIKTVVLGGTALAVLGYAGLQLGTQGVWPGGQTSSSREMAKPRKVKVPAANTDEAVAVIQVCFFPSWSGQRVTVPWALGTDTQYATAAAPLTCQTPWARSSKVRRGDTLMVGWVLEKGPVSKFKARITINNRQAMDTTDTIDRMKLTCVAGTPPCGF